MASLLPHMYMYVPTHTYVVRTLCSGMYTTKFLCVSIYSIGANAPTLLCLWIATCTCTCMQTNCMQKCNHNPRIAYRQNCTCCGKPGNEVHACTCTK